MSKVASAPASPAPPSSPPPGSAAGRDSIVTVMCKECDDPRNPDPDIIEDWTSGDAICRKCGLVADVLIDQRSEWRTFSDSTEDPSRVGGPEDSLMEGLIDMTSSISATDGGTGMSRTLNRAQSRSTKTAHQHAVLTAMREIENYAMQMRLPSYVAYQAKKYYKDSEQRLKNRTPKSLIAAALLLASRSEGTGARNIREVASLMQVTEKEVGRSFTKMKDVLKIETHGARPEEHVVRVCNALELDFKFQKIAEYVVKKAMEIPQVSSKSPLTIAASAIYIASNAMDKGKSVKDVATAFGIAEDTLRNTYKEMYLHRLQLFPPDLKTVKSVADMPLY